MNKAIKGAHIVTGAVIFTVAIYLLPLPWWHRLLIFVGTGMVIQSNEISR